MQQDLSPAEIEAIMKNLGNNAMEPVTARVKTEYGEHRPFPSNEPRKAETVGGAPTLAKVQFTQLQEEQTSIEVNREESVKNIKIEINAILGRAKMPLKKLLELQTGNVISLNKLAGEPVEIEANGIVIGWGEVAVIDDNFGVKVTQVNSEKISRKDTI